MMFYPIEWPYSVFSCDKFQISSIPDVLYTFIYFFNFENEFFEMYANNRSDNFEHTFFALTQFYSFICHFVLLNSEFSPLGLKPKIPKSQNLTV